MRCGEALVRLLEAYGVDTVFGIPGTHIVELYRGLKDRPIRHILGRHEQGVGFMADGYARATGRPGVCFVITGPGVLNAATPMATAYNDSIPMLVISADVPLAALGKGWGEGHELYDQRGVTAHFTALSAIAYAPGDLPDLVAKAFGGFTGTRPRPAHIQIPTDVLSMTVSEADFHRHWQARCAPSPGLPTEAQLRQAADLIDQAERPILYVGGGASAAAAEVQTLAETLAAPVVNTAAGVGILPGNHPLCAGGAITFPSGIELLEHSDLVIAVGTEMADVDRWYAPLSLRGALIRIDIDPHKPTDRYPAKVPLQGDARTTLSALSHRVTTRSQARHRETQQQVSKVRAETLAALTPLENKHRRVMETILGAAPAETQFFGDMTQLAYTAYRLASFPAPRKYHNPVGFGCLGYALPAGLGAKVGRPEHFTVVITGDSGLLYTVQEMATATDEHIPIAVLLWNNQALGEIRDAFISRGITPIAVSPQPPDNQGLAKAFGWRATITHSHEALTQALHDARESSRPTLIELMESDAW